jgi:predicted metal-dependent peptidase
VQPKTYVALVLDRSGSMGGLRRPVIDAFNQQLSEIRDIAADQDVRLCFYQFGSDVEEKFFDAGPRVCNR